ncbi:hypothetical protein [Haloechinothrix aidingensis]|nr:hypothetical protein [Haloechinothrix aidingensis]
MAETLDTEPEHAATESPVVADRFEEALREVDDRDSPAGFDVQDG